MLKAATDGGAGRGDYVEPEIRMNFPAGSAICARSHSGVFTVRIPVPGGDRVQAAPGASNGLKYINGLSVDGRPTDQTFLPESLIHTGGDVAFSLSGVPNTVWGTAESCAPPSFGADSAA
jgi:hypothetical protein